MSFTLTKVVRLVGILAALLAAVFWLWASLVDVPDDIDTIVSVLQRVSMLNALGAMAASAGAFCGMLEFWFGRHPAYYGGAISGKSRH
jgi:hypothetical protein